MANQTLHKSVSEHNADLGASFVHLMGDIEKAAVEVDKKLSRNGLIAEAGTSGEKNVYGEEVQKLDEYANQVITDILLNCDAVHGVASEELPEPRFSDQSGDFIITHDPLDGSSNIDTNLSIGTIFAVYPKSDSVLQKGSSLVAAGYILYGPSMMLVYATKDGVNGFTYDTESKAFVLTYPDIQTPEGETYAINEANWELFDQSDRDYLMAIKKEGGYKARYVGSMVGDVHRTLLKGGIFIYPSDSKHKHGKLRLLYEVAPMSFIIKAAGGDATSNGTDPLEITPTNHDQRVPIVLGSKGEVEKYLSFQSSE